MKVAKCGKYRLTQDFYTRGTCSCGWISKGSIIAITQIDHEYNKVIGPDLLDWTYNNMPLEPITVPTQVEPEGESLNKT